jgi:hypothetical protein
MSFDIEITTEALKSYARTDDAVEAFNMTVANGQTRLSLQVLVDIVNTLVEKIEELECRIEELSPVKVEPTLTVSKEQVDIDLETKQEIKVTKEKTEDKVKV